MSYYEDPYGSPEKHGLAIVGEVEWSSGSYEFDLTVVWRRDADGQLFYADDSGCSCPSPFEGFSGVDALTPCTRGELQDHLAGRNQEGYSRDRSGEIGDLMTRVIELTRGTS